MKIVLIGSGNIAWHMGHALRKSGHTISAIYGRNAQTTNRLARKLNARPVSLISELPAKADFLLVCLPDHEIAGFLKAFPLHNRLIAHTSGSVPLSVFPPSYTRACVFYPLQTFTSGRSMRYNDIPFCLEVRNPADLRKLTNLARSISTSVQEIDSATRAQLHLAAVFVNNFTNHLYQIGEQLTKESSLSFDLLKPLIRETADKIKHDTPAHSQTGPARRGDTATLEKHLKMLKDHPDFLNIYKILSESIEKLQGPWL